eukprot:TRINITY_DN6163_c0_g1_i2.p1 TRINITY_DN6163_c0_g1~~TRINITY_DN6163_c0_g1_i2.p1  ORF type:complete len:433 (+),score=82.40 TRINITY_DN6163_c0_g1_i2:627-1925(+)
MLQAEIEKYVSSDGYLSLPASVYIPWLNRKPDIVHTLVDTLASWVANGRLPFPLKKYSMTSPDILFRNLLNYHPQRNHDAYERYFERARASVFHSAAPHPFAQPHFYHRSDHFLSFVITDSDYFNIDQITDYFQELPRLRARLSFQTRCLLDQWDAEGAKSIIHEVIRKRKDINAYELREAIFSDRRWKECTQFKPTLAMCVMMETRATRVLDFSAGWGDRLVAAIAARQVRRYVGVDPNTDLKDGHDAIIERYATTSERHAGAYQIIYEPFEMCESLPHGETFDLVFTSPPYFDFEVYQTDKSRSHGQSIESYPRQEEWLVKFLFASLQKSWDLLDDGGYLALHLQDTSGRFYCEPTLLFCLARLPFSTYEGSIANMGSTSKKRRFVWVFRKNSVWCMRHREYYEGWRNAAEKDFSHYHRPLYEMLPAATT